jgi:hypothetical protein
LGDSRAKERAEAISAAKASQSAESVIPARIQKATCAVLLAALALGGACRPCAKVASQWEDRITLELSEVGAGNVPDTGVTDHIRVTLRREMLDLLGASLAESEVFRPSARAVAVEGTGGGSIVAEGEMTGRISAVSISLGEEGRVEATIRVDGVVALHFDAAERRARFVTTQSVAQLRVPLAFRSSEGTPVLALEPTRASITEVTVDGPVSIEGFEDLPVGLIDKLVYQLVRGLVSGASEEIALARWLPPRSDALQVSWAPSSLAAAPDGSWVTLGVVSELRPVGGPRVACDQASGEGCRNGEVAGDAGARSRASLVVNVHPDLWRAALVHAQATGRVPRRFTESGEADVEGGTAVAVDAAVLQGNDVSVAFEVYCMLGRCARSSAKLTGQVHIVDGDALASLDRARGGGISIAVATFAERALGALLDAATLVLVDGSALEFDVADVDAGPDGLILTGVSGRRSTSGATPVSGP